MSSRTKSGSGSTPNNAQLGTWEWLTPHMYVYIYMQAAAEKENE